MSKIAYRQGFTGSTTELSAIPIATISGGDASMVVDTGKFYFYTFDSTSTEATVAPNTVRPNDYVSSGVWIMSDTPYDTEQQPNLLIDPSFLVNYENYNTGQNRPDGMFVRTMWEASGDVASFSVSGDEATISGSYMIQQTNDEILAADGKTVTVSCELVAGYISFYGIGLTGQGTGTVGVFSHTFVLSAGIPFRVLAGSGGCTFKNLKLEISSRRTPFTVPQITEEEAKSSRYLTPLIESVNRDSSGANGVTMFPLGPCSVSGVGGSDVLIIIPMMSSVKPRLSPAPVINIAYGGSTTFNGVEMFAYSGFDTENEIKIVSDSVTYEDRCMKIIDYDSNDYSDAHSAIYKHGIAYTGTNLMVFADSRY